MPPSKPRRRKGHGEVMPPLSVLELVDSWLKKMLTAFPAKGELSESEIEDWHRDLGVYPAEAINYAFETHRRHGNFFPLYHDILDMCIGWEPEPEYKPGCSRECLARHGKGYNEIDVKNLYHMVEREIAAGRPIDEEALLAELDRKRPQGAPEWRRAC
jgi:hypothetical protein